MVVVAILIALLPAFAALVAVCGRRVSLWLVALVGGGGWLLALVLRAPILVFLDPRLVVSGYVASALAGLFEESVRFVLLRTEFVRRLSRRGATSLGLGWGLTEAVLIYALPVVVAGDYGLAELLPGAVERNSAVAIHTSLALLISTNPGSLRLLMTAIALHTAVNCLAIASLAVFNNVWVVEGLLLVVAVVLLALATTLARKRESG